MPYRNMSLDDFARYIGMDAREVRKLADRGKLPGQKVGGQWRFNQVKVTEWLQQEMHTLDDSRLVALERALGEEGAAAEPGLVVTPLIGVEGIDIALPAKTKASVLRELVGLAERTGLLYDSDGLLQALEEREAMCSTALPNGVAIPHPRRPDPYLSAEPFICAACLPRGIAFGSTYRELTQVFFLICCHEDRHHLQVLARLMRILDDETLAALRDATEPAGVLALLSARERQVHAES